MLARLALAFAFIFLLQKVGKLSSANRPPFEKMDLADAFARLPDSGSVCSVTLLVEKSWQPLSGHAFLELCKSDGRDSVVRYIGFYPLSPARSFFSDAPVPARISDDAYHPYHASLRRPVTPTELQSVLRTLEGLSAHRYQTDHFNSVDFALRVLAETHMQRLVGSPAGPWTPARLYRALKDRRKEVQDSTEQIVIVRKMEYAGPDHTPAKLSILIHHS
jgi:hypothetical protein